MQTSCEQCGSLDDVRYEEPRTFHSPPDLSRFHIILEEAPPDPNRKIAFCRPCAQEHHSNWDDQWREYYGAIL
jgi:hypothetical protein